MKKWAIIALCLLSSLASAKEMEEIVVVGRQMKVVLVSIQQTHKQNFLTGDWYYVADLIKASEESESHRVIKVDIEKDESKKS